MPLSAPETAYAGALKRPKPGSAAPKPSKRPMPGTAAGVATKSAKPPEPMMIARLMKTLAPMVAGGGK